MNFWIIIWILSYSQAQDNNEIWSLQPNSKSLERGDKFLTHKEHVVSNFEMGFINDCCLPNAKYLRTKIRITKSDCFNTCEYIFGLFDSQCITQMNPNMDIFPGSHEWCSNRGISFGYESTSGRLYKSSKSQSDAYGEVWYTNNIEIEIFVDFLNNRIAFFNAGLMQGWIEDEFNISNYPHGIHIGIAVDARDDAIIELLEHDCAYETPTAKPSNQPSESPLHTWNSENTCLMKFMVTISTFKDSVIINNRYKNEIKQIFISAFETYSPYHNKYHFNLNYISISKNGEPVTTLNPTSQPAVIDNNPSPPQLEPSREDPPQRQPTEQDPPVRRLQSEMSFIIETNGNINLICDELYSIIRDERFIIFIQNEIEIVIDDKGVVVMDFNLIN